MAAANFKNKAAFAFLREICKRFKDKYSTEEIEEAKDFDMSATFSDTYKAQMVRVASCRTSSTTTKLATTRTH
jgi:rRNA maturation endonuclease Nob1